MAYKKETDKSKLSVELKDWIDSEKYAFLGRLKALEEELDIIENYEHKRNHLIAERSEFKNKLANFNFYNILDGDLTKFEIQENIINAYIKTIDAKIEAFTLETSEIQPTKVELPKIKWNSKPSVFGYLFGKLAEKGLIDAPQINNVTYYKGYTELLMQHFELDTTPGYLAKELSASSISEEKKAKFEIPYLKDLL